MNARAFAFSALALATFPISFPILAAYDYGQRMARPAVERSRKLVQANINLRAENERLRREQFGIERYKVEISYLNDEIESQKRQREADRSRAKWQIDSFMFQMQQEIEAAQTGKTKRELLTARIKEHARNALHQIESEPVTEGNVVRIFKQRPTAGELPE